MRYLTLEEIKKRELEILKSFVAVCEREGCYYTLAYGTLLGAVRHKGFIPWDDDIDVFMPRPDYDKFIKSWRDDESTTLRLVHLDNGGESSYAKVVDLASPVAESSAVLRCRDNDYLWIDVFPVDALVESKIKRLILTLIIRGLNFLRCQISLKNSAIPGCWLRRWSGSFYKVLFYPVPLRWFAVVQEWIVTKAQYDNGKRVGSFGRLGYLNRIAFDRKFFEIPVKMEFEDAVFQCPSNYETILTKMYGDYMQLPPKEKRICHMVSVRVPD